MSKAQPWFQFLLGGIAAATLASCGQPPPTNALRVGMELAYPPFEMADPSGKPGGISVELAKALGEYLGRPVVIENTAWDGLIPALKTGKVDLVISSMTATDERRQSIDFSDPYVQIGLALLVRKDSGIQSANDLINATLPVAVRMNTTGEKWARENLPAGSIRALDRESSCIFEVVQGKCSAFLYDQLAIYKQAQANPETTRAILKPFQQEAWAIGIRKGNDDLRKQVNAFLADYRAKGGFDRLAERFLAEQKAAFLQQGIPFVF